MLGSGRSCTFTSTLVKHLKQDDLPYFSLPCCRHTQVKMCLLWRVSRNDCTIDSDKYYTTLPLELQQVILINKNFTKFYFPVLRFVLHLVQESPKYKTQQTLTQNKQFCSYIPDKLSFDNLYHKRNNIFPNPCQSLHQEKLCPLLSMNLFLLLSKIITSSLRNLYFSISVYFLHIAQIQRIINKPRSAKSSCRHTETIVNHKLFKPRCIVNIKKNQII